MIHSEVIHLGAVGNAINFIDPSVALASGDVIIDFDITGVGPAFTLHPEWVSRRGFNKTKLGKDKDVYIGLAVDRLGDGANAVFKAIYAAGVD
nr:hypothetical protein [Bacterioplanes sanyensis]